MSNLEDRHLDVFQNHHSLLFSIAYRMLGSASAAEDILQDAYLRFRSVALSKIEFPKAYLSAAVTRMCINQLTSARARRTTYLGPWLPEPVLTADNPDFTAPEARVWMVDSLSLAFLVLLARGLYPQGSVRVRIS